MSRHGLLEIEAVLAIAARKSFRAAAPELGLSTTALSNLIGKVERELGVRLFNRTTRSVSLTDAGRTFVSQVTPALRVIQDAMETARSQQDTPSGTLRINAFASGAREILAPLVLAFLRRYPQVHVDLVTEGRIIDIVAEGFDLGLRPADLVPSDMIAVPIGPPRSFAVVATPAYFERMEDRAFRPISSHTGAFRSGCQTARPIAGISKRTENRFRSRSKVRSRSMNRRFHGLPLPRGSASASSWKPMCAKTSLPGGLNACCRIGHRQRSRSASTIPAAKTPQPPSAPLWRWRGRMAGRSNE